MRRLSRRDFLKLAGAMSLGGLLSACGVDQISTPPKTLFPTLIPMPTVMPTSTATLTGTPTSTPMLTETPTTTPSLTATSSPTPTATPVPITLRDFASRLGIEIGVASPIGYFLWHPEGESAQSQYTNLILKEYNMVQSSWEFLWAIQETIGGKPFRPSRETYDFKETDLLVNFYQKNGLRVQVNSLIWGYRRALPSWLKNGNFSREELLLIIQEHIQTVVSRYKGKVHEWIVVNELFHPWEPNFWQDKFRSDFNWVEKSFEWAHEADPRAKLILNDFGVEFPGYKLYIPDKDRRIFNLIRDLKDKGVPIHGVGFQMHLYGTDFLTQEQLETKVEALSQNIQKYRDLGVDVYVTEFDVRLNGVPGSREERYELQGRIYGSLFKACLESGVKSFTIFGLVDRYSWLEDPSIGGADAANADPLPFDDNYKPKPAYYALLQVLRELYTRRAG